MKYIRHNNINNDNNNNFFFQMKHAHTSRNNYRDNELDCQGIIALYNKMNESSNIKIDIKLDQIWYMKGQMGDWSAIDGKICQNCIGLGLKYLKWDTTTTTKVDQSSPYPLSKISNKFFVYRHMIFLTTHSLSVFCQLLSRTTNLRRCPETWSRRRLHPS